jgi:phosphatidylserine decarboxylase
MKHSGKARKAALKLIIITLVLMVAAVFAGFLAVVVGSAIIGLAGLMVFLWMVFAVFTLYFFRDPNARVPVGANLILSPGHGKIDLIDTTVEPLFMGGECQRISMFLSVIDVHVQNAPVGGRVAFFKYSAGKFRSALKSDCSLHNENVLIGFEAAEPPGAKVGVRLIAGVLARRIVPWVSQGDEVARGDRISLIQFGSRVDVFMPMTAAIKVKLGDRVVGGETLLAVFE